MWSAIQFLLFCAVGAATTLIDFGLFNVLTKRRDGGRLLPIILANFISVAAAMTWSFLANWIVVFRPAGDDWFGRAGRFLATTAFSAFILQNAILYLTTRVWKTPSRIAVKWVRKSPLRHRLGEDAVIRNTCKALAVTAGLVWNFLWYKFFVYAL